VVNLKSRDLHIISVIYDTFPDIFSKNTGAFAVVNSAAADSSTGSNLARPYQKTRPTVECHSLCRCPREANYYDPERDCPQRNCFVEAINWYLTVLKATGSPLAEKQIALNFIVHMASKDWTLMEVCGGQTHAIVKFGIDELLPTQITLVHGPGCPVCVTPVELIEKAIQVASRPEVIFCSFGDMLRVPGSSKDLLAVKAEGGDVRIVYSPLDALRQARENPDRQIVFFATGFETTAPANAMAIYQARQQGAKNFSILVSHVLVPPAMETILSSPNNRVQGFLAARHVYSVMGYKEYEPIATKYKVPIVMTGF